MATYSGVVRRGLPRAPGGEPWPPARAVQAVAEVPASAVPSVAEPSASAAPAVAEVPATAAPAVASPVVEHAQRDEKALRPSTAASAERGAVRRGLPRVPGGQPWPPAGAVAAAAGAPAGGAAAAPAEAVTVPRPVEATAAPAAVAAPVESAGPSTAVDADAATAADVIVRRGLPRAAGGEPWPPLSFVPRPRSVAGASGLDGLDTPLRGQRFLSSAEGAYRRATTGEGASGATGEGATGVTGEGAYRRATAGEGAAGVTGEGAAGMAGEGAASTATEAPRAGQAAVAGSAAASGPLPFAPTAFPGRYAFTRPTPRPAPRRIGPFTRGQWAGAVIVGGAGLLFAAGMAVLLVRWFLSLEFMRDFLVTYPGEYHLPEAAPVGIPAWIGWQHFFNVFLMVLIIRSGLQVRRDKRPGAFWTPRWNTKRKMSLSLWFHQSLDILWIVNGAIFIVLLFATGQWMRIVPTSWEVFPNALSAVLQYISLDWPTENGWVNYNSIQQLAYFATVFLAAPLAVVTGIRMSGIWPAKATRLSKAYPIEWARAVHFPVMIYFVLFIVVHVTLVFATGALRNLNHMYAAQGSVDPTAYADNWAGFWIFAGSLLLIVGAWVAARPLVLAPIARLFGSVSSR